VTRPHPRHHHKLGKLVVGSTRPSGGTKLASGAKVAVKLVPAPKQRKRRR
jgi:hypothetical protein